MLRSILSTLAGIAVAVLLITGMQALGHLLFPQPGFVDPTDMDRLAAYVEAQPLPAKLWLLLGYILGTTGGVFSATLCARPQLLPALLVTAFLLSGVIWNLTAISHPLWLSAASIGAILMGGLTGFGLGRSKTPPAATPNL